MSRENLDKVRHMLGADKTDEEILSFMRKVGGWRFISSVEHYGVFAPCGCPFRRPPKSDKAECCWPEPEKPVGECKLDDFVEDCPFRASAIVLMATCYEGDEEVQRNAKRRRGEDKMG